MPFAILTLPLFINLAYIGTNLSDSEFKAIAISALNIPDAFVSATQIFE